MFDEISGCWVKDFKFTEDQKKTILECFGGEQRRKTKKLENAAEFISSLEPIIEYWINCEDEPSDNSEIESRLNHVVSICGNLIQAVSEVDVKINGALGLELICYNKKKQIKLSEDDTATAINGLMAVAQNLAKRYRTRSISKSREKKLIYKMAYCYWRVFGKPPGYSGASNFFMAVQKVSFILDVKIGEDIIKETVKTVKNEILNHRDFLI